MNYNDITFIKAFHENQSDLPTHENRDIDIFTNGHRQTTWRSHMPDVFL
jgi:hypothetical protein